MTLADLKRLVAEAKAKVASGSFLVGRAQKRRAKFERKFEENRRLRNRAEREGKPKKRALYQRRMARAKGKTILWSKREADAIEFTRDWKGALARRLRRLAAAQPRGGEVVAAANRYVGVQEGSALQRKWANDLGYSAALPWCSIFAANMLLEAGAITRTQLPANPAYSGTWIGWAHGRRVSRADARPGDLLIFDWGDGGITDHVAIYAGNGQKIGGNENDRVERDAVPWGNVVAIIRPV